MRFEYAVTKRFSILCNSDQKHSNGINLSSTNVKYVWLTKRIHNVTRGSEKIKFDQAVIDSIEEDIQKCRITRRKFQEIDFLKYGYHVLTEVSNDPSLGALVQEEDIQYDTKLFPLAESFGQMIGIHLKDLSSVHLLFGQDIGQRKNRLEKRNLLQSILQESKRNPFQDTFLKFILEFIAPHVRGITKCERIYFQSFPCIRVMRPGEFSIGPHCDASYGFSQANINFYVPLTKIYGTNSLILESSPGLEDWHTIELDYGGMKRFYGAQCSHFTSENTTQQTRISLDFRVIEEKYWQKDHDHYCSTPGYYSSCRFIEVSNANEYHDKFDFQNQGEWVLEDKLLAPDWRCGFPFEKEK